MNREHISLWLAYTAIKGIGWSTTKRLLERFETLSNVLNCSDLELKQAELSDHLIGLLRSIKYQNIDHIERWLEDETHQLITIEDKCYPRLLKEIPDAPLILYLKGDARLLHKPQIAIVGSRNPSVAGKQEVESFTKYFIEHGLTITSGMALGIDGLAHQTALANNGHTIAVVATGLDRIYPAHHKQLAVDIAERGLLISEFALGTGVRGRHFPKRNRIISGLSLATLVIEAALKSGSLITAYSAIDQGRDVFAIPGSIHNPLAKGCHKLIKQGGHLVETGEDVLAHMQWLAIAQSETSNPDVDHQYASHVSANSQVAKGAVEALSELDDSLATQDILLQQVMHQIDFAITAMDDIVTRTKLPVSELSEILLQLEMQGSIAVVGGGYQRLK
ncbi:MAG: DNA-processing protein DprA [Kangiellaceae bacterium]|jgi:DNA processing protein|nr:DNA-processing protein DprA [Kangiellaceae bacterium]